MLQNNNIMQDKGDPDNDFLFDISEQVKGFYETPVIFVTKKDYSDIVFNSLCDIREAFISGDKKHMLEQIVDFHLQWLHTVNDIEIFKTNINDEYLMDDMCHAISFTIDALTYRMKHYQTYIESRKNKIDPVCQEKLNADLEIIEEMHSDVTHVLLTKIKTIRQQDKEFQSKVYEAADELLQWIDKIYNALSLKISGYINLNAPQLTSNLSHPVQQLVDEIKHTSTEAAQKLIQEWKCQERPVGSMIRTVTDHSLEIKKISEKIDILDDRMKRMKSSEKSSPTLVAIQNKKEYLENRLSSVEKMKTNLKNLLQFTSVSVDDVPEEDLCTCEDYFQLSIFQHSLSLEYRERLVTELCYLWDVAVLGERSNKSIISILSAADIKEEFTDELGTFYVDEHGRKIYKLPDDETETRYQPNELNELVPVSDDAEHIYFYDECGRYFVNSKTKQRVYQAHASASQYMMDSTGVLLKVQEERDGVTYYYDNFGRYYINEEGKHIYRDADAVSEYENDGLGNLVRKRSHLDIFEPCPDDAHVTEDFQYLKETVSKALRASIAQVLIHQPSDPIKYLSFCLIKYRENIEFRDRHAKEQEDLNFEREVYAAEQRAKAEKEALEAGSMHGGSEASFDSNLFQYQTLGQDGPTGDTPNSK